MASLLTQNFRDVAFDFRFVACTGAKIADFTETRQDAGANRKVERVEAPQLEQVATWLGDRKLDAFYMNIGGNDGGFADIVTSCLLLGCGEEHEADLERDYWEVMDESFDTFNRARNGDARGFDLHLPRKVNRRDIFITTIPDFTEDTDESVCTSSDFERDRLMRQLSRDEVAWARDTALNRINTSIADAADQHGWTLITGHEDAWSGHGICAAVPFANTNVAALAGQGDDMISAFSVRAGAVLGATLVAVTIPTIVGPVVGTSLGLAAIVAGLPVNGISSGIAHPNAAGYGTYVSPIFNQLRPLVLDKLADGLEAPTDLRVARASRNGPITLRWKDNSSTEVRHEIEVLQVRAGNQFVRTGPLATLQGQATLNTEFTHRLNVAALVQYGVKACVRTVCSPQARVWAANNRVPQVANLEGSVVSGLNAAGGSGRVVIHWDGDPAISKWFVQRQDEGSTFRTNFDTGFTSGLTVPRPADGRNITFRVAGCNRIGCSQVRTITVDTSNVPVDRRPTIPDKLLLDPDLLAVLGLAPDLAPTRIQLPPIKAPVTPTVKTPAVTTPLVKAPAVQAPAVKVNVPAVKVSTPVVKAPTGPANIPSTKSLIR